MKEDPKKKREPPGGLNSRQDVEAAPEVLSVFDPLRILFPFVGRPSLSVSRVWGAERFCADDVGERARFRLAGGAGSSRMGLTATGPWFLFILVRREAAVLVVVAGAVGGGVAAARRRGRPGEDCLRVGLDTGSTDGVRRVPTIAGMVCRGAGGRGGWGGRYSCGCCRLSMSMSSSCAAERVCSGDEELCLGFVFGGSGALLMCQACALVA